MSKKEPNTQCERCGKRFYRFPSQNVFRHTFCSPSCRTSFLRANSKPRLTRQGYVLLLRPDHPMAKKSGYVLEHRMVMSDHLDRILDPKEEIHHINGDRQDNRIENLILFGSGRDHQIFERTENPHKWKKKRQANPSNKVALYCPMCGRRFEKYKSNIKSAVICCSKQCTQEFRAIDKRFLVTCVVCGKEFTRVKSDMHDHPTCSLECSWKHRSQGVTLVECVVCGKQIEKLTQRVNRSAKIGESHTCSKYCSGELGRIKRSAVN